MNAKGKQQGGVLVQVAPKLSARGRNHQLASRYLQSRQLGAIEDLPALRFGTNGKKERPNKLTQLGSVSKGGRGKEGAAMRNWVKLTQFLSAVAARKAGCALPLAISGLPERMSAVTSREFPPRAKISGAAWRRPHCCGRLAENANEDGARAARMNPMDGRGSPWRRLRQPIRDARNYGKKIGAWVQKSREEVVMEKLKRNAGDLLSRISSGFSHGLGQMAAFGTHSGNLPYRSRSTAKAFRGDWVKVGSDLGRAIDAGRERHREKA